MFLIRIADYFFFTRPILFFPAYSSILMVAIMTSRTERPFLYSPSLIALSAIMGSCFVINQIFDIESDRENNKLFFLPKSIITVKSAWVFSTVLLFVGIILAQSNYQAFILVLFFIISGLLYNIPLMAWKNKIWSGLLSNILMSLLVSVFMQDPLEVFMFIDFWLLQLLNALLYTWTTIPDIKGDQITDKKTIAVYFNKYRLDLWVSVFLIITSIFASFWKISPSILIWLYITTLSCIVKFFVSAYRWEFHIRILLLTQALIVTFYYIDFAIWLIALYFSARFYYQKRFHFNYPRLINE